MTGKYDNIINLPHHVSKTRIPMAMEKRAAQFAPFAALTGHSSAISETGRQTEDQIFLEEDYNFFLDEKLSILNASLSQKPEVTITYFLPDTKKSGGAYETITGVVKKIDYFDRCILMDHFSIPLLSILDIEGEIFNNYE